MTALTRIRNHLPLQAQKLFNACIIGLAAGAVAVLFHVAIHWLFSSTIEAFAEAENGFLLKTLFVLLGTSVIATILISRSGPEAAGSGIAQLKLSFWKDFGVIPLRITVVKFFAGILSIGGGLSLGREGPTVQISGGLASYIGGKLGMAKQARRGACAAGAAAGLAAAFNTPLAAITFVLEEIIGDLNSRYLGLVLLSSVIGAFTVHATLGNQPAFQLDAVESITWIGYAATPIVAAAAAALGLLFQSLTLKVRGRCRATRLPNHFKRFLPLIGSLTTWAIGCLVFVKLGLLGVFGLGYGDLTAALAGDMFWKTAGLLLLAKFVCVVIAYGAGGCGGIFAPLLFLGGMIGYTIAGALHQIIPLSDGDITTLAIVGMCACFGSVVRAPITGILMLFEMTHQFLLLPPLLIATLVSQVISLSRGSHNFYDGLLKQDGHDLNNVLPPRDLDQWRRRPVGTIASFEPRSIPIDSNATAIEALLEKTTFDRFPIVNESNECLGVISRDDLEQILKTGGSLEATSRAVTAVSSEPLATVQHKLIESPHGIVMIVESDNRLIGLLTLHDILRKQMEAAGN
jgi:CIC family chloride channel protein